MAKQWTRTLNSLGNYAGKAVRSTGRAVAQFGRGFASGVSRAGSNALVGGAALRGMRAGSAVRQAAKASGQFFSKTLPRGFVWIGNGIARGAGAIWRAIRQGAGWLFRKIRSGVAATGNAVRRGARSVGRGAMRAGRAVKRGIGRAMDAVVNAPFRAADAISDRFDSFRGKQISREAAKVKERARLPMNARQINAKAARIVDRRINAAKVATAGLALYGVGVAIGGTQR